MAIFCAPRRRGLNVACLLLGLVALAFMTSRLEALDKFWDGGAPPAGLSGVFSDRANWNTILPPDSNDVAHFGASVPGFLTPYTVTFTNSPDNDSLIIEDDKVTFDLNGNSYETLGPSADLIGNVPGRTGSLTVVDGIVLFDDVVIVGIGGGSGNLTIGDNSQRT